MLLLTLAAPAAHAQDASSFRGVEVTPYASMGSASGGVGTAVRWPLPGAFSLELETGYRQAEVDGVYSNLNVLYDLPRVGLATPYLATGVGIERYGTADGPDLDHLALRASHTMSVNAGGGVRVAAGERWDVRSDMRWSNGIGAQAPERWRLFNGVSVHGRK
jgi:hypothetical protein